jgi:hypothetical protein
MTPTRNQNRINLRITLFMDIGSTDHKIQNSKER